MNEWLDSFTQWHGDSSDVFSNTTSLENGLTRLRGLTRNDSPRPNIEHCLNNWQWLRVAEFSHDQDIKGEQIQALTPLAGFYQANCVIGYLLYSDGTNTFLCWGIKSDTDKAIHTALKSTQRNVECVTPHFNPTEVLKNFKVVLSATGVPNPSQNIHKNENLKINTIDQLLFGLSGNAQAWAWLVICLPVPTSKLNSAFLNISKILEKAKINFLREGSFSQFSHTAQRYSELLESQQKLLDQGLSEGGWLSSSFVFTSPENLQALQVALGTAFRGLGQYPEPWALRPTHNLTANNLSLLVNHLTYMPSSLLRHIVDMPQMEHAGIAIRRSILFNVVPPYKNDTSSLTRPAVVLGTIKTGNNEIGNRFILPLSQLGSHLFVCGITGSGKSHTIKNLITQTQQHNLKLLIIEPVKHEYRQLGIPNLRVYSLGEPNCTLKLNPLFFEGVACTTHLDHLKALFSAAYPLYPPMPYILEQALYEVYQDKGWDFTTGLCWRAPNLPMQELTPSLARAFPTLSELLDKVMEVIDRSGYGPRLEPEIRAALQMRLNNLRIGAKGQLLDIAQSVTLAELTSVPTVIEMQGIGDPEQRAFLIGLLLTKIYEGCLAKGESEKLQLLVVIEEAHRLLEQSSTGGSVDFGNPQAKAIQVFADILAEMRAYGVGVVVVEQSPSRITRQVLKNTATKIVHQLVDAEDWRLMGGAMAMNDIEAQSLATLPRGDALVFITAMDRPIRIAGASSHLKKTTWVQPTVTTPILKDGGQNPNSRLAGLVSHLAADQRIQTAFAKLIYTSIFSESQIDNAHRVWVATIKGGSPMLISETDIKNYLSFELGLILSNRIVRICGRLFNWSFEDEEKASQLLAMMTKTSSSMGYLRALKTWWQPKTALAESNSKPYPGCDLCKRPCEYRPFVKLSGGEAIITISSEIKQNDGAFLQHIAKTLHDRSSFLINHNSLPMDQGIARCFAAHWAHIADYTVEKQRQYTEEITAYLEEMTV